MNLFKRDDYYAIVLMGCEVEGSEISCKVGYWQHPVEGVVTLTDSNNKTYSIIGPQKGHNVLHLNPTYDLEIQ